MNDRDFNSLVATLWPSGDRPSDPQIHAIVDAARDTRLIGMIRNVGLEHTCLLAGELSPALEAAAPHLVHLSPKSPFTRQLFELGWFEHWCLLTIAAPSVSLNVLRQHFRKLLRVQNGSGHYFMFRFYDPRVFQAYLPTCTHAEASRLFGPIDSYVAANGQWDQQGWCGVAGRKSTEDAARTALSPPLIVRNEQISGLQLERNRTIALEISRYIITRVKKNVISLPEDLFPLRDLMDDTQPGSHLSEQAIAALALRGVARARAYGLSGYASIRAFVALMFAVAPNFDEHPFIWALLN